MQKLEQWHKTKLGLLTFAVVELILAVVFACLSIDRGNLWWYLLTLIFFIGTVKNLFRLMEKLIDDRRRR